ncbi:MAG: hypothetical protein ACXWCG_02420 [Flavitalea sp.]
MKEDKKKDLSQQEPLSDKDATQSEETSKNEDVKGDSDEVQTQIPGTDRTEEGYRIIESGLGVDE